MKLEGLPKINNLENKDNQTLSGIEQNGRDNLAIDIRTERKNRDNLVTESKRTINKIVGIFDKQKYPKSFLENAKRKNIKINNKLIEGKYDIEKNKREFIIKTIEETITEPLKIFLDNRLDKIKYKTKYNSENPLEHREYDSEYYESIKNQFNKNNLDIILSEHPKLANRLSSEIAKLLRQSNTFPKGIPHVKEIKDSVIETTIENLNSFNPTPELLNELTFSENAKNPEEAEKILNAIEKTLPFDNEDKIREYIFNLAGLTEFILTNDSSSTVKEVFENLIYSFFSEKDYYSIGLCFISPSKKLKEIAKNKINTIFKEEIGISLSDLIPNDTKNTQLINEIDLKADLQTMLSLEKKQKGSVKRLLENYGIKEFYRYPEEMLLAQLDEEKNDQPYGMVVFPRGDHNTAFDQNVEVLNKLFNQTRGHYGLKVFEIESKIIFARDLIKLKRYENKISFMILGGHGSEDSIAITEKEITQDLFGQTGKKIKTEDFDFKGTARVKDFFVENPKIILVSCSTGAKEDGIAQKISQVYGAEVIAPNKDTNLKDIETTYDSNGKPNFDVVYASKEDKKIFNTK